MKLQGIIGKGSGKLGSSVFAVSGGEQIARIYTDKVSNPNTAAQVAQRSKLKLASQLAAAMAPVIAIPKQGLKSSRNLYMKKNMPFMTASEAGASIEYEKIQLTTGSVALPAIVADTDGANVISVALAESAMGIASRVCYVAFQKNSEEQLMLIGSTVVESAGNDGTFPGTLPYADGELVIYAYGMRDNNSGASAKYGNYTVANGEDLAQLITSRTLSAGDYSFTGTVGTTIGGWVNPYPGAKLIISNSGSHIEIPIASKNLQSPVEHIGYIKIADANEADDLAWAVNDGEKTSLDWDEEDGWSADISENCPINFYYKVDEDWVEWFVLNYNN